MASPPAAAQQRVLVVGATGKLGRLVVKHLRATEHPVRALVRPGTDAAALEKAGVEVVRGDLMQPATLAAALSGGVHAVVTTAAGYTGRRRGDSLETDRTGNRNLADAAKAAGVQVFVLCSVLTCDKAAATVPHFAAKYETEQYIQRAGLPYVFLRPGAFLDPDYMAKDLANGKYNALVADGKPMSFVHPDDVARCLAMAVDEPRALNRAVDLGSDRALDGPGMAAVASQLLNRPISVGHVPRWLLRVVSLYGLANASLYDFVRMMDYFNQGTYVADTTAQAELFPPVPTVESGVRRMLIEAKLLK